MNLKTRKEIAQIIKYELAEGTHTFTMCSICKKRGARSVACWSCWLNDLVTGKESKK